MVLKYQQWPIKGQKENRGGGEPICIGDDSRKSNAKDPRHPRRSLVLGASKRSGFGCRRARGRIVEA